MDSIFGEYDRLEFSHKRLSSHDPNTFHVERTPTLTLTLTFTLTLAHWLSSPFYSTTTTLGCDLSPKVNISLANITNLNLD